MIQIGNYCNCGQTPAFVRMARIRFLQECSLNTHVSNGKRKLPSLYVCVMSNDTLRLISQCLTSAWTSTLIDIDTEATKTPLLLAMSPWTAGSYT
jgi:hypothetical protein